MKELIIFLIVICCIVFRKVIAKIAQKLEETVEHSIKEQSLDYEKRTIEIQKRLEALDAAHPNRVKFADIHTLFESNKYKIQKEKEYLPILHNTNIDTCEFKNVLESHSIKYLVHFTQEKNIDSIIKYGLLPKNMLHTLPTQAICNDDLRLDSREDTTCLSIGFPNNYMFWKYRKIGERQGVEWCVIVLNKKILTEKECLFIPTNAASGSVNKQNENAYKGVKAFEALYTEGKTPRMELGLPNDWPTNPQAEVMVKGIIESRYILAIMFDKEMLTDKYKLKYPLLDICTDRYFFNTREYSLRRMQIWQYDRHF